eukprot:340276_1
MASFKSGFCFFHIPAKGKKKGTSGGVPQGKGLITAGGPEEDEPGKLGREKEEEKKEIDYGSNEQIVLERRAREMARFRVAQQQLQEINVKGMVGNILLGLEEELDMIEAAGRQGLIHSNQGLEEERMGNIMLRLLNITHGTNITAEAVMKMDQGFEPERHFIKNIYKYSPLELKRLELEPKKMRCVICFTDAIDLIAQDMTAAFYITTCHGKCKKPFCDSCFYTCMINNEKCGFCGALIKHPDNLRVELLSRRIAEQINKKHQHGDENDMKSVMNMMSAAVEAGCYIITASTVEKRIIHFYPGGIRGVMKNQWHLSKQDQKNVLLGCWKVLTYKLNIVGGYKFRNYPKEAVYASDMTRVIIDVNYSRIAPIFHPITDKEQRGQAIFLYIPHDVYVCPGTERQRKIFGYNFKLRQVETGRAIRSKWMDEYNVKIIYKRHLPKDEGASSIVTKAPSKPPLPPTPRKIVKEQKEQPILREMPSDTVISQEKSLK